MIWIIKSIEIHHMDNVVLQETKTLVFSASEDMEKLCAKCPGYSRASYKLKRKFSRQFLVACFLHKYGGSLVFCRGFRRQFREIFKKKN